jgi:hypothetical protein
VGFGHQNGSPIISGSFFGYQESSPLVGAGHQKSSPFFLHMNVRYQKGSPLADFLPKIMSEIREFLM